MPLLVAHQILIGSAIGLAVLFGLRAGVLYFREHASTDLGLCVGSLVVAGLLYLYFRSVRAKWLAQKAKEGNR